MDPLALGVIVFLGIFVALALVSARASRGRPLSEFGQRGLSGAGRQRADGPERSADLEYQDLTEMLAATNALRGARGLPERTLTDAVREFSDES